MMWLVETSVKRAVFAVMFIAALVGLGLMSMGRIGIDLFPEIDLPYVSVTTVLEGASPNTIETEVSIIIEDRLSTIDGIESMQSFSSEGKSRVIVEFALSSNIDVKTQDVRDKIQQALAELPQGVDPPVVEKADPDAAPILSIVIASEAPIREITAFADDVAKKELQSVAGVGSVNVVGGQERAIRIWLDNDKMRALSVSADDVRRAVQTEHAEFPGGRMETTGLAQEFGIKTMAQVKDPAEFAMLPVAYRPNGVSVKIGDIARVEDGEQDERSVAFLNGKRGVALEVRKQSGQNSVAVARGIKDQLAKISALAPAGTDIIVTRDTTKFIESSIHDVGVDLRIAMVLVVFVCFLFLLDIRATLIVATVIPTSLIATFFAFYIFNVTINIITLLALTVAIGLLVDDAIVVVEAISRELEEGKSPVKAALDGTRKVALAVLAGTVATLAVFVPIVFMDGLIGRFFFQYALAIVFSVSISWIVAMTLTPMLASRLLKKDATPTLFRPILKFWNWLDEAYGRVVLKAIRFRYPIIALAFASLFLGGWYASQIPSGFLSKADRSEFLGTVELPIGTGLGTSKEIGAQLETSVNAIENVEDIFWTIGGGVRGEPHKIDMYVAITPKKERDISQFSIMDTVRETLRETVPQAEEVSVSEIAWVTGTISGGAEIDLILNGPDLEIINEYADALIAKMNQTGAFENSATSSKDGRPEAQLVIDRRKAADQAVSARSIANISRITLGGLDAGSYEENGDRFDIRLRLKADQRQTLDNVGLIQVRNQSGKLVDFASISQTRFASGLLEIQRQNRSRKVSVISDTASDTALGDATDILEGLLKDMPPPQGMSYQIGGYADIMREAAINIGMALLLALVVLYMVLASQFNSFVQPPIIMVTAPLSFSGAFAAIYYFGFESSIFVQIGLIGLMGIVMKNGILLVDRANQLMDEGLTGREAIARACPERLRPVLMTAFSAIFGMVPVALATSDGSEFRAPVGALIIGGLTTSTFLTLIVVPAAFMIPRDIRKFALWVKSFALTTFRKAPNK